MEKPSRDRVGVFLEPHTRDRLNKFVADTRYQTGRMMSQSGAINLLLDHYAGCPPGAAPKQGERERMAEPA